ncbi:MAG: TlpA disulfide reductase family protein [Candidatus Limnocylindrales bacterium]
MWPRLSIILGLATGVLAAVLMMGALLAFAPEVAPAVTPAPTLAALPSAVPSVEPSTSPSVSPSASPSTPGPSPTVSPSATTTASTTGSAEPSELFHVGEPAPALVVPQVGGGTIDLANLLGKPVWVNFMATWCPPCVDEFPLMNGFAARYADDGLVVLAIDVKEEEGIVAAFAERLGTTFPLGLDRDGTAAERWDAIALPVHFWIDKDGIVRDGALGGIGPDIMARGLGTILPGITVTP